MLSRFKKVFFLFCGSFFLALPTWAQVSQSDFQIAHRDFFNLYAPNDRELNLSYRHEPSQEEDGGPGGYTQNYFSVSGEVPVPLDRDSFLIYGGTLGARFYDFDNVSTASTAISSDTLQKYVGSVGYGKFITDDLLLKGVVDLGLYSDFSDFDFGDALQVYGRSTLVYRLNPGTQFVTGIYSTDDLDDMDVFPILGFRTQSTTGKVHIAVTAPVDFQINYNQSSQTQFFLKGIVSGERYNIEAGPDGKNFDVDIKERRVGTGARYWFTDNLNVSAEMGLTLDQKFEFRTTDAGQFDGDMDSGFYFALGFGIGL